MRPLLLLFAALALALPWCLPNRYPPWGSFQSDMLAAFAPLLLLLALAAPPLSLRFEGIAKRQPPAPGAARPAPPWAWPLPVEARWLLLCALLPWVQLAAGLAPFLGDAVISSAYLAGLGMAVWVGRFAAATWGVAPLARWCMAALGLAGAISLVLATMQWLDYNPARAWIAQLSTGSRPYANVGQSNNLATLFVFCIAGLTLWLERGHLPRWLWCVGTALLAFGLTLTQSRAGGLSLLALVALWWLLRRRAPSRVPALAVAVGLPLWLLLTFFWGHVNQWLGLAGDGYIDRIYLGARRDIWLQYLHAIADRPWFGYGWNQGGAVQAAGAVHHPGDLVATYAHNLVIDLLAWNGVPLGLALSGALALWVWRRAWLAWTAPTPERALLLAVLLALGIHSMLELPFAYAYFLVPVGLLAGAVTLGDAARAGPAAPGAALAADLAAARAAPRWRRALLPASATLFAGVLALIAADYVKLEHDFRAMRFEERGMSERPAPGEQVQLLLLDQLGAITATSRITARSGMPQAEQDLLRQVAYRHHFQRVMFKHAVAAALNGQPAQAALALRTLRARHGEAAFAGALRDWRELAASLPAVAAVPLPPAPAASAQGVPSR